MPATRRNTPLHEGLHYRWREQVIPWQLALTWALPSLVGVGLLSSAKPWSSLPKDASDGLALLILLLLLGLLWGYPLLCALACLFNTTSIRIEGEHLAIAHQPIGRTRRIALAGIARMETTSRHYRRMTVWRLTAHHADGSRTCLLKTTGRTFPVAALTDTRKLFMDWQWRMSIQPPPADAPPRKRLRRGHRK